MRAEGIAAFVFALTACSPASQAVQVPYPAPDAQTLVVVEGPLLAPTRVSVFERGGVELGAINFDASTSREVHVVAYEDTIFDLGLVTEV